MLASKGFRRVFTKLRNINLAYLRDSMIYLLASRAYVRILRSYVNLVLKSNFAVYQVFNFHGFS